MTLAAQLPPGSVVVADEQTAGMGRHGHSWESEPGAGLYMSVVLMPHPVLTLALGLAAQEAVRKVTLLACDIRWPNDLMLGNRKFGGILVQLQDGRAIAGIGINTGQRSFPPDLRAIATSLAIETNLDFRRDDILDALLECIPPAIAKSEPETIEAWERSSSWARGKPVTVDLGDRIISGITAGLDADGFLRVRTAEGTTEIVVAGGVRAR
jgi:BirA family biotin operon repressor/biotin-[acetyl-CoA-carboxylase] ligase